MVIDFGDTNLVICLHKEDQIEFICDSGDSYKYPSLVGYNGGIACVGTSAKRKRLYGRDGYYVSHVKKLLGLTWEEYKDIFGKDIFGVEVVCGRDEYPRLVVSDKGRWVTCVEVAYEIFRTIKEKADIYSSTVKDCYILVPANYKDSQREAMKEAAEAAGLQVKSFILKPVAVAMSWYYSNESELTRNDIVLVFDFGKSSLDISLLKYDGNGSFSVIDTDGDPTMGGDDVDYEIAKKVCKKVEYAKGSPFNPLKTKRRYRFLTVFEQAKIDLSVQSGPVDINVSNFDPDIEEEIEITQSEFNLIMKPFVDKIDGCIDRMMNQPDRSCEMIKEVIIVGRSFHLVDVMSTLRNRFTNATFPEIDSESVTKNTLVLSHISKLSMGY